MDENNVQNALEQGTTPDSMEQQQAEATTDSLDTAPQGEESVAEAAAQGGDDAAEQVETPAEPFLEIQYNHEKRGLSRDEAAALAQKGIRYEGTYNALERFATLKGVTVDEFIGGLEKAEEDAHRESLMERFGGDEDTVEQMMELYHIKKRETLENATKMKKEAAEKEEQSVNARIAEEFVAMKRDFPELTEFGNLPKEVCEAAYKGEALAFAYLKFKHKEAQKIAAAAEAEKNAAEKSTGSMSNDDTDTDTGRRYLSALWGG